MHVLNTTGDSNRARPSNPNQFRMVKISDYRLFGLVWVQCIVVILAVVGNGLTGRVFNVHLQVKNTTSSLLHVLASHLL